MHSNTSMKAFPYLGALAALRAARFLIDLSKTALAIEPAEFPP